MLNDLANESPLWEVAKKYQCNKGILQALQQGASTYAGMSGYSVYYYKFFECAIVTELLSLMDEFG